MKIIEVIEAVEAIHSATSTALREREALREAIVEPQVEQPRPWPHDGVVRSWAY